MSNAGTFALIGLGAVVGLGLLIKWDADWRWPGEESEKALGNRLAREQLERAVARAEMSDAPPTVRLHALSADVIRTITELQEQGFKPGQRVYLRRR